jgi:hypothetical protein
MEPKPQAPRVEPTMPPRAEPEPIAPAPVAATTDASHGTPVPADEPPVSPVLAGHMGELLREWIVGGNADDDKRADVEMIQFLSNVRVTDLAVVGAALDGLGKGMLYRLAARAGSNVRLLDVVARAANGPTLEQIVRDAAYYDPAAFARQIAERRRRGGGGAANAADAAMLRLARSGPPDVRVEVIRELRAIDPALATELTQPESAPPASGSSSNAA